LRYAIYPFGTTISQTSRLSDFSERRRGRGATVARVWICLCEAVTSGSILDAVESGARTVREVGQANGAGTVCGKCTRNILLLIQQQRDHREIGREARE
jgi:bacterioferritin-associated ferredoxin